MTDQDKLNNLLKQHNVYTNELGNELLALVIDIAGEKLIEIERTKYKIYKGLLEQKVVKPQYMATLYDLMNNAKEKLDG